MNAFRQGLAHYLDLGFLDFLQGVRVGVVGAGGLGSNCAMHLVRSGFSDLILADPDHVEPSNLNRQCYFAHQLGRPKVLALAENLRAVHPAVRITTHETTVHAHNAAHFFGSCQAVIEAVDEARAKKCIIEALATGKRLIVGASGLGGAGRAGHMQVRRLGAHLVVVGDLDTPCDAATPPFSPGVGMAAAMQADVVLHHFLTIYQRQPA